MRNFEGFVDTDFLCKHLRVSRDYIETARKLKGLPCYKLGRVVRYRVSEVNDWLKQRRDNGNNARTRKI
jgi:excisionase family DNA binding protein